MHVALKSCVVERQSIMAVWYIEAHPHETWKQASRSFWTWFQQNTALQNYGFSEGDAHALGSVSLHCFCVPDHHGAAVGLFEDWAKEQGRVFGRLDDSIVRLSSGDSFSPSS